MDGGSLLTKEILLIDGGLGTTLEDQYDIVFSADTPLWSSHLLLSSPATLREVQGRFARSGADIVLTPTYQASHDGFRKTVFQGRAPDSTEITKCFESAVGISRSAFGNRDGLVALSLGAYGAVLQPSQEYSGDYGGMSEASLKDFHAARMAEFKHVWNDVDIIAFETLPRLDEVRAVKAVLFDSKPFWISCVFPNERCLPDGSTVGQLVQALMSDPQPWAIGVNCTKVDKLSGIITDFEIAASELKLSLPRLVVYPDGTNGLIYDTTKQKWIGEERAGAAWDEQVAKIVRDVQSRGRWKGVVVGGCCKTTPEHIAKLRTRLDNLP